MASDEVTVRQCEPDEVRYLLEFEAKLSWQNGGYEHRSFNRIDPSYLLVAIDRAGVPVGFGGVSLQAPGLCYLSSFIVREDRKKQGVGRKLWKAMMAKAGTNNIALDTESEMAGWYQKNGFSYQSLKLYFHNSIITEEMKGEDTGTMCTCKIISLSEDLWPSLMEYDRLVYPDFDREKILTAWFTDEDVSVVAAVSGDTVVGYGSIVQKQHNRAYSLRNVYADSEAILEAMLRSMFADIPVGSKVHFMLVDGKPMPRYLQSGNPTCYTQCARLYSQHVIKTNTEKVWLGSQIM